MKWCVLWFVTEYSLYLLLVEKVAAVIALENRKNS